MYATLLGRLPQLSIGGYASFFAFSLKIME
jgi:hypothetical protein